MAAINGNGIAAQISMQGTYQGRPARVFHVMGQREDWTNTTQFQDVAEYVDPPNLTFTDLTGTENLELVSGSAQDAPGGTGTYTVQIVYIDSNYALAQQIYTLNGLTPVPVGVLGAKMILSMEARSGGSSEVSVGRINLRTVGTAVVQETIVAGSNRSLSCRFMVPDGYEAFVTGWDTHAIRTPFDCRIRATVNSFDRSLCSRYIFQDLASMGADQSDEHSLPWLKFPARCKLKVSAIPGSLAGNPRLDVSFTVILIAGD